MDFSINWLDLTIEQNSCAHVGSGVARTRWVACTESELVQAALDGKSCALEELWLRYAPMVHALMRRGLGAHDEVEDLVQEVFMRICGKLHTLQKPDKIRSFTYSVALRVLREQIRRMRRRTRNSLSLDNLPEDVPIPSTNFESREALRLIELRLAQMDTRQRTTLWLRRLDGMELADVADAMGTSLATVKRDLEKASQCLSEAVEPAAPRSTRDEATRCLCESAA